MQSGVSLRDPRGREQCPAYTLVLVQNCKKRCFQLLHLCTCCDSSRKLTKHHVLEKDREAEENEHLDIHLLHVKY